MKTAELQRKIDELEAKCSSIQAEIKNLKSEAERPELPTYADVVEELKPRHYFGCDGIVDDAKISSFYYATKEIAEREKLRCQWLNIAEYVNRRHVKNNIVYVLLYNNVEKKIGVMPYTYTRNENTFFNSEEAALEALAIMGEENYKKMIGV